MTPRETPPFRADHVGSLLRPQALLQARDDTRGRPDRRRRAPRRRGRRDPRRGEAATRRRPEIGHRRRVPPRPPGTWTSSTPLDGISKAPGDLKVQFHNEQGDIEFTPAAMRVDGKLGVSETIFGDAFEFLKTCASDGQTPKLTIPSPSMVHYRGGRAAIDPTLYPDLDAFWADLAGAYREEVRRLGELGCTYLQFDDTSLAYLNDPRQREHVARDRRRRRAPARATTSATSTRRSPAGRRACP